MFRKIRRFKQEMPAEECRELLKTQVRGVLSLLGDDGYPYAIPINFFYDEPAGKIYFHGAHAGHKVDALRACDKICFTVYGNETVKDEAWAPYMQSAVVFGRCHMREYSPESMEKIKRFAMKYYPEESMVDQEIADTGRAVQLYEIDIEYITGKEVQER